MLDTLFQPRPARWGIRGDPLLWKAMAEALGPTDPATIADIEAHLRDLYADLVGAPLTDDDTPVSVPRFASGGMSSSMISPRFWREEGIPLLVSRFPRSETP